MTREGGIIQWQWQSYDRNHRDRVNLLMHFVAVPLFIAGAIYTLRSFIAMQWVAAGLGVLCMIVAFGVQAIGHKREAEAPIPFAGPLDVIKRIFTEQFITFPRFVLSGGWTNNISRNTDKA